MAVLTPITINKKHLKNELKAFNHLLNDPTRAELKENQDILPFFDANKNLCAFMGSIYNSNILAIKDVSIAREFDVFGDHSADLVIGDENKHAYTFVEFEDAQADSIFVKRRGKRTPEWSTRFDHGNSQLIDWILWIDANEGTPGFKARFHAPNIQYNTILVIGRDKFLTPDLRERMDWRSRKVVIASHHVHCITFDELHDDLMRRLEGF
jgi:Domain of unknown function (DUF4263)